MLKLVKSIRHEAIVANHDRHTYVSKISDLIGILLGKVGKVYEKKNWFYMHQFCRRSALKVRYIDCDWDSPSYFIRSKFIFVLVLSLCIADYSNRFSPSFTF